VGKGVGLGVFGFLAFLWRFAGWVCYFAVLIYYRVALYCLTTEQDILSQHIHVIISCRVTYMNRLKCHASSSSLRLELERSCSVRVKNT